MDCCKTADGRVVNAVVFDLDGTLLDTLPDLVELTNATLRSCGYPERTHDEILGFVGSGVKALIRLAVPPEASDEVVEEASERWKQLYPEYGYKLTQPYPGVKAMLARLKERGIKLAVLSNKFDGAVREVVEAFLPDCFDSVHGESPEFPRKPDPTGLNKLLAEIGVSAEHCVFVGDSSNDTRVARAAGAYAIGVTWGYNDVATLRDNGADLIVDRPEEILAALGA